MESEYPSIMKMSGVAPQKGGKKEAQPTVVHPWPILGGGGCIDADHSDQTLIGKRGSRDLHSSYYSLGLSLQNHVNTCEHSEDILQRW